MPEATNQANEIFLTAIEQCEPADWPAYLDEACSGDSALRRKVEKLLHAHQDLGTFQEDARSPLDFVSASVERRGVAVGPYTLLQKIGEGGMGVIYMAEQTEPVERRVALKIIRPGMDTRKVIARFEAERQALALMDHPNIARVYDAGTTDQGKPYFVMELVQGVPVTQYCDEKRLTPRERLELFVPICQAVQHAHQKGIIHRDIKPTNVLVTEYDDRAVPKVIDFGIAKAIEQRLTQKTLFTEFGQVVGTPEYMSPEQTKLNQLDIDTRTDVYSLGVLLYQLLTGETPFDRKRLRSVAFDELLRIIREEDPPRPSRRLSSSASLPSIAANRHFSPRQLSTLMHGELDWIVMKALEKDRARRYETASSFAADVEHYLHDEAVTACPPSKMYRLRKFARRNKTLMATTAIVATALVVGIAGTGWQAIRAMRAEASANQNFVAERIAHEEAERAHEAETEQRRIAEAAMRAAEQARADADEKAEESRKSLVRQFVREGTGHVDDGDYTLALPWFVKALELDHEDPQREQVHRLRIATTLDRCPKLTQVLYPDFDIQSIDFLADGQRVLLYGGGRASIWDLTTGEQSEPKIGKTWWVAVSPDKQQIACVYGSYGVALRNSTSGETVREFAVEGRIAQLAGFSADGENLFVAYDDATVRIWNAVTGSPIHSSLNAELSHIQGAKFTPDGRYLVVADNRPEWPDQVVVWEVSTGKVVSKIPIQHGFEGAQGSASSLVVTDDFIGVATDVFVQVVNLSTGKNKYPLLRHADGVSMLLLSPDATRLLSTSADGSARIWDAGSGELLNEPLRHRSPVFTAAFSEDGKQVVTASSDGEIKVWNSGTGQKIQPVLRHPDKVQTAQFSSDGRFLLTVSHSGARLWDLGAGLSSPVLQRRLGGWAMEASFSPDGQLLGVGSLDHFVRMYDSKTGRLIIPPVRHTYFAHFLGFSPDGQSFLTSSADGMLALRHTDNGQAIFTNSSIRHNGRGVNDRGDRFAQTEVLALMDLPSERIYTVGGSRLHAFDGRTGEDLLEPIMLQQQINDWRITDDRNYLVLALGNRYHFEGTRIEIRELPTMNLVSTFPMEDTPYSLSPSRDGKRLLVGAGRFRSGVGYAQVLDFRTGSPLTRRMPHQETVFKAQFLADETRVLTNSMDGVVRLWDSESGRLAAPETRIGRWATAIDVPSNEAWLAAGTGTNNADGVAPQELRLWDFWMGLPISPPFPHGNTIVSVAISPDDNLVAATSRDNTLRVYEVPHETRTVEDLAALVSLVAGMNLDESDTLTAVDAEQSRQLWSELHTTYPDEFAASHAERMAWHRERVERLASRGEFGLAVQELDELIKLDPVNPELYLRRIRFNKRIGYWDTIPSDAVHVIDLEFREGWDLADLAYFIASGPEVDKDVVDFAFESLVRSIEQAPQEAHTYLARGRLHAELGNWQQAQSDFTMAAELEPGNFRIWYELALVQLKRGDQSGYQATCRQMLAAIPATQTPLIENFIAWTCGLSNAALDDWTSVLDRASWTAQNVATDVQYRGTLGLALLRAKRLEESLVELSAANQLLNDPSSQNNSSPAYVWYALAMVQHRLDAPDEARSWLDKANKWTDPVLANRDSEIPWNRRLTLELLRSEAQSLINPVESAKDVESAEEVTAATRTQASD